MKLLIIVWLPVAFCQSEMSDICEQYFDQPNLQPINFDDFFASFVQKAGFYMLEKLCYSDKKIVHNPDSRSWNLVWTNSTGLLRTDHKLGCSMYTLWKDKLGFLKIEETLWNLYEIPEHPSLSIGLLNASCTGLDRVYYLKNDKVTKLYKVKHPNPQYYEPGASDRPFCDPYKMDKYLAMLGELSWEDHSQMRSILFVAACFTTFLAILGAIWIKFQRLIEFNAVSNRVVPFDSKFS